MTESNFINNFLSSWIDLWFFSLKKLSEHRFEFQKLLELYKDYNSKINISSIKDDESIVIKHFVDSLVWLDFMDFNDMSVIDIWTWWWYPILPLAITCPSASFTALDSVNKKLSVIWGIASDIWINNISLLHWRAEDYWREARHREQYDIVTQRAFAPWPAALEMCSVFIRPWGFLIAYQTPRIYDELKEKKYVLKKLWLEIVEMKDYDLALDMWKRVLIIIKKLKKSPAMFPRKPHLIRSQLLY